MASRRKNYGKRDKRAKLRLTGYKSKSEKKAARRLRFRLKLSTKKSGRMRSGYALALSMQKEQRNIKRKIALGANQGIRSDRPAVKSLTRSRYITTLGGTTRSSMKFGAKKYDPSVESGPGVGTSPDIGVGSRGGRYGGLGNTRGFSGARVKPITKILGGTTIVGVGAKYLAEEAALSVGLDYIMSKLPDSMNPYKQSVSKQSGLTGGIGVYFKNFLLGIITEDAYADLRSTASRYVQNKLRAH